MLCKDVYQPIVINCNLKMIFTDYDRSDHLYFKLITLEDVLEIIRVEQYEDVIMEYGWVRHY